MPSRATVLDIGCGTGQPIAHHLTEQGCIVTGVDSSPEMIAMAKDRQPAGDWLIADMRTLSLSRTFDGLLAWDSFFHLGYDDQRRMFAVFRRHANAGAALMFTSGPSYGEAIGRLEGEPLFHASLDGAEYRTLLDAHGFAVVAHAVEDPECGGHTIWLARLR
ncbi:methyltransferase [Chelatococcus reniformis]|uniref:Methyltransferase n=1 Tax=Chelatococcus reniformis TaxID=1494448 RepID=A0A916UW92_9HYPH|nr:methyltransferase [Chelatococcus reniformis]